MRFIIQIKPWAVEPHRNEVTFFRYQKIKYEIDRLIFSAKEAKQSFDMTFFHHGIVFPMS